MFKRQALICIGVVVLSYVVAGCGVRPQVDFYVVPIATDEGQKVDEETGSVTMRLADFSITVSTVDIVDLLRVTSDVYINPYVHVGDWGVARPRYTVLDVTIKNNGATKTAIDLSDALLMDEEGAQYESVSYEELRERYEAYPILEREILYYPHPYVYYRPPRYRRRQWRQPWYYRYDRYRGQRPYYVRRVYDISYIMRVILKGTMLKPVKLYPGGKQQGFLVFPVIAPDATELKIIFPGFLIEGRPLEFHFERTPAVKD